MRAEMDTYDYWQITERAYRAGQIELADREPVSYNDVESLVQVAELRRSIDDPVCYCPTCHITYRVSDARHGKCPVCGE